MVGDVLLGALAYGLEHLVLGLLVAFAVLAALRDKLRVGGSRDPIRRFSGAEKAEILARAGHRCEHHGLSGRCSQREGLEADHAHPHSRGGWTSVDNGQALCRRHNKAKRARVPSNGELRRLAQRRTAYFPPGVPTTANPATSPRLAASRPAGVPAIAAPREDGVAAKAFPGRRGGPRPTTPVVSGDGQAEQVQFRRFDPPRPVEVLVDGTWLLGLQQAWRQDAERGWIADVSLFQDYDRVRLPSS
ncbi:MAG TPA: HNH endonuclease [Geodermatophilus sp.]|nr:HNH endonuclease [Geodermatophilus sp.]